MVLNDILQVDVANDPLAIVQEVLRKHPLIQIAIVFGSAGTSRQRPSSDVDVAVAAPRVLVVDERMALMDDLALPFGRPVDLVDLMAVSGVILQQALCRGRMVLNRDPLLHAQLILRMWYDQVDLMPNRMMIINRRLEAFIHG